MIDYYGMIGISIELLSKSAYHKKQILNSYISTEIVPPLELHQVKAYVNKDGLPIGIVTWAWLSNQVEDEILSTGRPLAEHEWNCGENLFFNDWITPYGDIRYFIRDMTHEVFPDHVATSIRRSNEGSIRKVNRWTGKNLRTFD